MLEKEITEKYEGNKRSVNIKKKLRNKEKRRKLKTLRKNIKK
jgi:hypothetical protein